VQAYGRDLPSVTQCFVDDFEVCIAHLRFPLRHRKVMRTTDENVKWWVAASGNRLGVGTGDPDRSVGHEAASKFADRRKHAGVVSGAFCRIYLIWG
jgi:hypothetical protein